MLDIMLGLVLLLIVGVAVLYIVKEKKKGTKCIGCPMAGECKHKGNCHADAK